MKVRLSSIKDLNALVKKEKKAFKKKQRFIKIKLFFTLVLPAVLALFAVQVSKTFLQIQLKKISLASAAQKEQKTAEPVSMIRSKPEFIKPVSIQTYHKDL